MPLVIVRIFSFVICVSFAV